MEPDQLLSIFEDIGKRAPTRAMLVAHSGHPPAFVDHLINVAVGLEWVKLRGADPLSDATVVEITDKGIHIGRTKLQLAMRLVNDGRS